MNKIELAEKITSRNFIFINKLVELSGGSKKGTKSQDIQEILEIWGQDPGKVEQALKTLELNKAARRKNLLSFFSTISKSWELVLDALSKSPKIGEDVLSAIEDVNDFITLFKKKS